MWAAASRGEGGARWRKPGRGEGGGADLGWSASEGGPAMEGLSPAGLMRIWVMGSPGLEEAVGLGRRIIRIRFRLKIR